MDTPAASTTPATTPATAPARPYVTESTPFGSSVAGFVYHPVRVYPSGIKGTILTDDERAMLAYVEDVEAKLAAAEAERAKLEALVEKMEPAYLREQQKAGGGAGASGHPAGVSKAKPKQS